MLAKRPFLIIMMQKDIMAAIAEVPPDISINSAFRRLFIHVDDVFDRAEELRLEGVKGKDTSRRVGATDLVLGSGNYLERGQQSFYRTLNVRWSGRTIPLVSVTKVNSTSNSNLTIADAVPRSITMYPRTEAHLRVSISRLPARPDDTISLHIGDSFSTSTLTAENVYGLGDSLTDASVLVGDLPEEDATRLKVINGGLHIATSSIVLLMEGQPIASVFEGLQATHTELFMI